MPPVFDPRDKSRTSAGKTYNLVKKNTQPPADQGGWMALTRELLECAAYRSLSVNGRKALDRLIIEHISHGRSENGKLVVTHDQFYAYGVTFSSIADALDELAYKGLVKCRKAGRAMGQPTLQFTLLPLTAPTTARQQQTSGGASQWRKPACGLRW